jgi:hypothetical protein
MTSPGVVALPAPRRWRLEDHKFEASPSCIARMCFNKPRAEHVASLYKALGFSPSIMEKQEIKKDESLYALYDLSSWLPQG